MEYLSVKEAAQKWEISERYVQRYCTEGRVEGAVKFGKAWAIPIDAQKPDDLRKTAVKSAGPVMPADAPPKAAAASPLQMAMPLLNTPFPLGSAKEAAEAIEDPDLRAIALAEYYYFSGQSAKASDLVEKYLRHEDWALRLSSCWLYAYSNLAMNRIYQAREAMAVMEETLQKTDENTSPFYRALAVCVSTGASVLLHLPLPKILSPLKRYIHMMPPGLRLFVLYIEAHHSYLNKQYGACIGIAETALVLESELYPIPSIYLHLVASMGYINMKYPKEAKAHLLEAWQIAKADDLIEAFGEHHGLLCGMLEAVIKKDSPVDFARMIDITYSFSAGWRKIHNSDTGRSVADDLTTTEFAIAMLAARDWTNKEISAHLGISTNTVKLHLSSTFQKLCISQRKELAQYMLK